MKKCIHKKQTYLQQLTAVAKRAHTWAFVLPLSQVTKATEVNQRVIHHSAVRY